MFWEEEDDKTLPFIAPDIMFDVMFSIKCKSLPIDHAWELSQQILQYLPWLTEYSGAGIHHIHVAESNNGWLRPDNENSLLFPSKRTKLSLRIPSERFKDIKILIGKKLDISGHSVELISYKKKKLGNSGVIFTRHMIVRNNQSENELLRDIAIDIKKMTNTNIKKMLCGKTHIIKTPKEVLKTIHLMIADLDDETSIKIQEEGLGEGRELGCGIFLPHKSIKTLKPID